MRSFGSTSCSVHVPWASQNTQSATCARELDEAMMENFCYHLPLSFFFHSVLHFHLRGKGNLRLAAEWEVRANPSQVLELALRDLSYPAHLS